MSTVFYNQIAVSGARADVLRFRKDARRRLSASLKAHLHLSTIDLSLEKLCRLQPQLRQTDRRIPDDALLHGIRTHNPVARRRPGSLHAGSQEQSDS
jgi:hypothetical protein